VGPAAQTGPLVKHTKREIERQEALFFYRAPEAGEVVGPRLQVARAALRRRAAVAD
jgi:hypothetical protein